MDKEIVMVVPDEQKAYDAYSALERLDDEASIELHSAIVVAKEADGRLVRRMDRGDQGVLGTLLGAPLGAMVGLLGGPVGAAAGAAIGGSLGLTGDIVYSGIGADFVREVGEQLKPGMYAIVASVWEDWTMPVDRLAADMGGRVFRTTTQEVAKAQLKAKAEELKAEQEAEEEALAKAEKEQKEKLEATIQKAREQHREQRERIEKRVKEIEQSLDEQVAKVQSKVAQSKEQAKQRHEEHAKKLSRFAEQQKKAFHDLFG